MIFVTVGTTKFPFERLFKTVDKVLIKTNSKEKLIVQSPVGYNFLYPNVEIIDDLPFLKMIGFFKKSRISIVHGGVTSMFLATKYCHLQPIIFPRYKKYGEHTNNNQVEFCKFISSKILASYVFDSQNLTKKMRTFLRTKKRSKSNVILCSRKLLKKLDEYCLRDFEK